ncbi:MAG: hypothetical protein AAB791_01185 [Patescibacteria group bacterium]
MADINLLPENLREMEEKELKKLAGRKRVLTTEMAFPQREKKDRSWWKKSNDTQERKPQPAVSQPEAVQQPSTSVDLLSIARKQKMKYLRNSKPKVGFREMFGAPRSPLQTSSQPAQSKPREVKIREDRRSFWSELFKPEPKKLKLVVHAPPSLKSLKPADIKPIIKEEIKKMEERKEVIRTVKEKKPWFSKPVLPKPKLKIKMEEIKQPKIKLPEPKKVKLPSPPKPRKADKFNLAPKKDKSFDINLMPRELVLTSYYQPGAMAAIILLAVVLPAAIVGGVWWGITNWQEQTKNEITAAQGQINALKKELADWQQNQKKSFELQKKLLVIRNLFSGKIRWTNFLDLLEKYTLDGVYYTNFAADVSGEFTIPAVAKDYDTLAKQIVALREAKDFVKKAEVENIRLFSTEKAGISGVSFDLKLYLADGAFTKK